MSIIRYFARYSQKENLVTNNTLLLLLRFYNNSPLKFQRLMDQLFAEQDPTLASAWLRFEQQTPTGKSVVDGYIKQESVRIAVETKLYDDFDVNQLKRHMNILSDAQHKLLVLLSPSAPSVTVGESVRQLAQEAGIHIILTSFEDIISRAKLLVPEYDEEMTALVEDYEAFCSETEILPTDNYTMFVPPCGQSFDDNKEFSLYYCPVGYNRRKTAYLGVYSNRAVQLIGKIKKVVACDVGADGQTVQAEDNASDLTDDEKRTIVGVVRAAKCRRNWDISTGHKFFLCDGLAETDFQKATRGGIQGHRYVDLREHLKSGIPTTVQELANALRGHRWS